MELAIGSKIKALREQQKICQQDLCGELINRTTLSKIENDKMYPSIPQLIYLSKKFNVPPSMFLEEELYLNKNIHYSEHPSNISPSESPILCEWYNNNCYGNILKLYELEYDKFKALNDFNKFFYLGMSFFKSNLNKQAQKSLKKYINQYTEAPNDMQQQNLYNFIIALNHLFALMYQGMNYSKAEHYLVMAKKYLLLFNERECRYNFVIHSNLATLYNDSNQYRKTIKVLENFLCENFTKCYIEFVAQIHLSLNIAYYNVSEYKKSIDHIKKAIFFYHYIGDTYNALNSNLNLINAFRYDSNFNCAVNALEEFKDKAPNYEVDFPHFLVQEMILLFNMENFDEAIQVSKNISLNKLSKISKANFNFILGHINFLNNNYAVAYKQLLICVKPFIKENYSCDLAVLYNDLFIITKDETYKNKAEEYAQIRGRKNIIV